MADKPQGFPQKMSIEAVEHSLNITAGENGKNEESNGDGVPCTCPFCGRAFTRGFFIVGRNEKNEWDIECRINLETAESEVPQDQSELYSLVEKTSGVIRELKYTPAKVKRGYVEELLNIAKIGLTGKVVQTNLATTALNELRDKILLYEGGRIKNRYMWILGKWALASIIIAFIMVYLSFKVRNTMLGNAAIRVYICLDRCHGGNVDVVWSQKRHHEFSGFGYH